MVTVRVLRPATLAEALARLAESRCTVLAGGTDLLVRHRTAAGALPDLSGDVLLVGRLDALRGIARDGGALRVGAAATFAELLESPLVPDLWKEPFASVGSPAVRNVGTIGGNVANASPAGDSLPLLAALDGVLLLQSARGERMVPFRDFHLGPGRTALAPDELLVALRLPLLPHDRGVWWKVGPRRANAVSKLSFLGLAAVEDGIVRDARMALGAVAPTVVRVPQAETLLAGLRAVDVPAAADRVLALLSEAIRPIDDVRSTRAYRREVSLRLARRFLEEVLPR